jgi:hypothetical protein
MASRETAVVGGLTFDSFDTESAFFAILFSFINAV